MKKYQTININNMKKLNIIITLVFTTAFCLQSNVYAKDNFKITPRDSTQNKIVDLVCKMKIKPSSSKTAVSNKLTYYFCSESCKQKFIAEPSKYLKK